MEETEGRVVEEEGRGGGTKEVGAVDDEEWEGDLLPNIFRRPPTPPTLFLFLSDDFGGVGREGASKAFPSAIDPVEGSLAADTLLGRRGVLCC